MIPGKAVMLVLREDHFKSSHPLFPTRLGLACLLQERDKDQLLDSLAEIPRIFPGLVTCALVDEGARGLFMQKFQVPGTPTLILFKDGKEIDRLLGVVDAEKLRLFLAGHLGGLKRAGNGRVQGAGSARRTKQIQKY